MFARALRSKNQQSCTCRWWTEQGCQLTERPLLVQQDRKRLLWRCAHRLLVVGETVQAPPAQHVPHAHLHVTGFRFKAWDAGRRALAVTRSKLKPKCLPRISKRRARTVDCRYYPDTEISRHGQKRRAVHSCCAYQQTLYIIKLYAKALALRQETI